MEWSLKPGSSYFLFMWPIKTLILKKYNIVEKKLKCY